MFFFLNVNKKNKKNSSSTLKPVQRFAVESHRFLLPNPCSKDLCPLSHEKKDSADCYALPVVRNPFLIRIVHISDPAPGLPPAGLVLGSGNTRISDFDFLIESGLREGA